MNDKQKAIDLLDSVRRGSDRMFHAYDQISKLLTGAIIAIQNDDIPAENGMVIARNAMNLMADLRSGNETPADVAVMAEKASKE